jgi:hypothetical protein
MEVTMCKVLNKHHDGMPASAAYIGRGSKWAIPSASAPMATARGSLRGTRLGCATNTISCGRSTNCAARISFAFCAPRACHGDLLLWLANATREERIAWWRGSA